MLLFFIFSSAYVFHWVLNWEMIQDWFDEGWFGMILLLVIAGVVSFTVTRKVA